VFRLKDENASTMTLPTDTNGSQPCYKKVVMISVRRRLFAAWVVILTVLAATQILLGQGFSQSSNANTIPSGKSVESVSDQLEHDPRTQKNPDGGVTLYLRHKSPGPELESNWLPAPNGPMGVVLRLYLPKPEVLSGKWQAPSIETNGPA
jgi:hypothetical protein